MSDDQMTRLQELLQTQEDLDPELADYLDYSEEMGWTMIRHPLVYSVPHFDAMNATCNERLRAKKEALVRALKEKNWIAFLFLHERPYRVDAFSQICWRLGDKKYWELLGDIWTDTENMRQNLDTWRELLTSHRRYRNHFMSEEERSVLAVYPARFPIYRGYAAPGDVQGLSWTANPVVAKFFANRLAAPEAKRFVARGIVRRRDVFAFFDGRDEHEIVVLPENVTVEEITEVKRG